MTKSKDKNQKGQIAIFFAVGFAFFVVLLTMIINSSILTAQKIKLQVALDLATKQAAQVQADHINQIIDYNRRIETRWTELEARLNAPVDLLFLAQRCGAFARCPNHGLKECPKKDKKARIGIFAWYMAERLKLRSDIVNEIEGVNGKAYDAALGIVLKKHNLPNDISLVLKKAFGGSLPESDRLVPIYATQKFNFDGSGKTETIKERFALSDDITKMNLFLYEDGKRIVSHVEFVYRACAPNLFDKAPSFISVTPGKIPLNPGERYYQIDKTDESYLPFFFAKLTYNPMYSFNIFSIFKNKEDTGNKKLLYEDRIKLAALSMARPIGGDINDELYYNNAELIGMADTGKINMNDKSWKKLFDPYLH